MKFIARVEQTMAKTAAAVAPGAAHLRPDTAPAAGAAGGAGGASGVRGASSANAPVASAPTSGARPQVQGQPTSQPQRAGAPAASTNRPPANTGVTGPPSRPAQSPTGQPSSAQPSTRQAPPAQQPRRTGTIPDSAAPPDAEEYVEPIEPDLEPDPNPGGWAVARIPGAGAPHTEAIPARAPNREANQQQRPGVGANAGTLGAGGNGAGARKNAASAPVSAERLAGEAQAAVAPATPFGRPVPPRDPNERQRYGESVVREILGASFIEEQPHVPRVIPRGE